MTNDYLNTSLITGARSSEPPLNRSRTGYGNKLGSHIELQINKRWHRVYYIQWSNSGTAYVLIKGQPKYINSTYMMGLNL